MLFSDEAVARFLNDNFEPVWQSVRPVPIVTIDFGNGTKVTRTLHGNVATLICTADGEVLDALPGIYAPQAFVERLEELKTLHLYATGAPASGTPARMRSGLNAPR